jgi:SAM-dependent methyltransferase
MLFNIMHHDKPEVIYKEAFRILKPGGKVGIIHWRNDIGVPAGLKISIRPKPEDLLTQYDPEKFSVYKEPFILEPYHFGIILQKL